MHKTINLNENYSPAGNFALLQWLVVDGGAMCS